MENLSNLPEKGDTTTRKRSSSVANELNPSVEDEVATGTKNILDSPYISDGPGRVANAPVPSVYVSIRFPKVKSAAPVINLLCPAADHALTIPFFRYMFRETIAVPFIDCASVANV